MIRSALIIDPTSELSASCAGIFAEKRIASSASASYGLDGLQRAYALRPDLIVIRVTAPFARPLELIRRLTDALSGSEILAVLDAGETTSAQRATAAGASFCLEEPLNPQKWRAAINAVTARADRKLAATWADADPTGQVVTVVGSNGGVGKTSVAVNVAVSLANESKVSVVLVDGDSQFGDVAFSMAVEAHFSFTDFAAQIEAFDVATVRDSLIATLGVSLLPSGRRPTVGAPMSRASAAQALNKLRTAFDFVVVDTGGAYSDITVAAMESATTRILVTIPDLASARNAARAIRWLRTVLGTKADDIQLLQNRVGMDGGLSVSCVTREVGHPTRWLIPDDARVRISGAEGVPVVVRYPRSPAALAMRAIAQTLAPNVARAAAALLSTPTPLDFRGFDLSRAHFPGGRSNSR